MVKIKKKQIILIAIIALGFILRIWGINFGLPFQFHQDEPVVVNHALAFGSGGFNPHFFAIPPLTSYLLFFIYGIYFIVGKVFGIFQTTYAFAFSFFKDPTIFYLLGRIFIGVIPGVLCIFFVYKLYKELFHKENAALFAAAVIAFSFLNVSDSHYIYTDMLLSLAIIISMIRVIKVFKNPSLRNYVICAVFIGISISVKYNAAILLMPFFIAHILCLAKKRTGHMKLILALCAMIIANFITNPFAWLDFKSFLPEFLQQKGASGYIGWLHHIKYSLHEGLGIILLVISFLGFIAIARKEKAKAFIFLSFPVVFYLHLVFLSQPFARYVLPLMPFLAISAGYFIFEYIFNLSLSRIAKPVAIFILTMVFVFLITKSIKFDMLLVSKDTRVEAAEWIKRNIPPNLCLAFDHTFFRPALAQSKEQISAKYPFINKQKGLESIKDKKIKLQLEAQSEQGFCIYFLRNNFESPSQFLNAMPSIPFDFNILRKAGIHYIVINYASRQGKTENFYAGLTKEARRVYTISPYYDSSDNYSLDPVATTCMPVSSQELFRRIKSGPALEIYELK